MNKTFKDLASGFAAGVIVLAACVAGTYTAAVDNCAKKHDRYTCEIVVQPVGGEVLLPPVSGE